MKSILLVDTETIVASGLQRTLCRFGFHVEVADSTAAAHAWVENAQFDLILTEFELMPRGSLEDVVEPRSPKTSCLTAPGLIRELRATCVTIPILVYTVLDGELYETASLDAGADDYIIKRAPISILLSRLHAHVRRSERDLGISSRSDRRVEIGRYTLDRDTGVLLAEDQPIVLTSREMKLLQKLAANPLRIVSHEELLNDVWGNDLRRSMTALAASIKRLRQKMYDHGLDDPIESVRGRGCRLSTSTCSKDRLLGT